MYKYSFLFFVMGIIFMLIAHQVGIENYSLQQFMACSSVFSFVTCFLIFAFYSQEQNQEYKRKKIENAANRHIDVKVNITMNSMDSK